MTLAALGGLATLAVIVGAFRRSGRTTSAARARSAARWSSGPRRASWRPSSATRDRIVGSSTLINRALAAARVGAAVGLE